MEPVLIAAVACAFLAFMAILVAHVGISIHRQTAEQQRFAEFRIALLGVQESLALLKRALSRGACREMGAYIGARTCAIQQGGVSKDMLVELLADPDRRGYVLTAFELGLRDSKAAESIRAGAERLVRSASASGCPVPVIGEILRSLSLFVDGSVRLLLSPDFYEQSLLDPSVFDERVAARLGRLRHSRLHHRELAEIVSEVAYEAVDGSLGKLVGEAEQLVHVIVRTLTRTNDGELARFAARANRAYRKATRNGVAVDRSQGLERALALLELLMKQFHVDDRPVLRNARTALGNLETRPSTRGGDGAQVRENLRRHDEERTRQIEMLESSMANRPAQRRSDTPGSGNSGDRILKPGKTLEEQIEEEDRDGSVDVFVEDDE